MVEKKVDVKEVRETENAVRDVKNWLAVFKTEYDLSDEATKVLSKKVDELAGKVGGIKCVGANVDANSVKSAANSLRDIKAWLAVFSGEYDVAEEAIEVLGDNLEKIGEKLGKIKCK